MKLSLNYFTSMTGGRTLGRRIYGRYGVLRIDTYNRFIQGFVPHYTELASEGADAEFNQKANPAYSLIGSPGVSAIRAKGSTYPSVLIANESAALGNVLYSTDLWHFYSDDPVETDLGIPSGTPATNAGIDAVIFNSKILTSHPLNADIYHAAISASPSWTGVGTFATGIVKILKVIEDQCLVLDSSQGSGKPRDRVKLVQPDFSIIAGFALASSDYDIQDIADYQARFALLFARKTTSGSAIPNLSKETTVFVWDIVPGDSYTSKLSLPGSYQCSIVKSGVVYAFTQVGTTLHCFAFNGSGFQEIGRLANTIVSNDLLVPKTRIGVEGDFFVILASSAGNTGTAPLYWNPAANSAFYLLSPIDNQPFKSLLYALNASSNLYARYFSYQNVDGSVGTLYKCALEAEAGMDFISDRYDESNQDQYYVLPGSSDDTSRAAQSFTAKGGKIAGASFYLAKDGTPTGTMVAKLYAHTGTFGSGGTPTGSALATSDTIDISVLASDPTWIDFTFSGSNIVQLVAGQHYFISFEYAAGTSSNRPKVGYDNSTPTHPGNAAIFFSSAWTAETSDLIFAVKEQLPSSAAYKSNPIPIPAEKESTDVIARAQIERIELVFNQAPPTSSDSIILTLITKDEYESETYNTQTATVKDTSNNSTNANVDAKRAIIQLGAKATEFEIDLAATIATASWDAIIRDIVIVYEPIALQF